MATHYFAWKEQYDELHKSPPIKVERPIIGITGNLGEKGSEIAEGYYESVLQAGGVPLIIPPYEQTESLLGTLETIDGLLLSGGGDPNPLFWGEEPLPQLGCVNAKRDKAELTLIRLAYNRQIPMLGICRGMQMMVAALDGSLYQDIAAEATPTQENFIKHNQELDRTFASHTVSIAQNSQLYQIFKQNSLAVNSFHHQAVKESGERFTVVAKSCDGVIEAIESAEYKAMIGVQWHPECFILRNDECMMPLFRWFVQESLHFAQAKQVHRDTLILDSHCDTPMWFEKQIHFEQRDPKIQVDLHKMYEGKLDASIMVAYLEQKERDEDSLLQATAKAQHLLNQIVQLTETYPQHISLARTPSDLYSIKQQNKRAIMLGIENGYAIGKSIEQIAKFKEQGVIYMTLCHNGDNDICDSAKGKQTHNGVSEFGQQVIKEMNRIGMVIDLSHASEKSFYDTLQLSKLPVVCSHSSSKALCDVPRNLSDEQLYALAQAGGVAQVTLYSGFLRKEGEAHVEDVVAHLRHMSQIMGVENVGIGTDFDGDGGVIGCASASELINLTRHLLREHFNKQELRGIWGENFMRVIRINQTT